MFALAIYLSSSPHPAFHSFDMTAVYMEVRLAYDNVEQWAKPQKADFNVNFFAMSPKLQAEPRGVVLLVAPFNFPALLIFSPLVRIIYSLPTQYHANPR